MPRIGGEGGVDGQRYSVIVPGDDPIFIRLALRSNGPGPHYESAGITVASIDPVTLEPVGFQFIGAIGGYDDGTFRATFVSTSETARFVELTVQVNYVDERHEWVVSADITGLDTLPLIFDPLDAESPLAPSETDPEILVNTGFLAIYHMDADIGIGTSAPVRIDQANRRAWLPAGEYVIYDVNGVATGIPFNVFPNPFDGTEASISFDDTVLSNLNYFPLFDIPMLGGQQVTPQEMHIDDRGVVFGFTVDLPDSIGVNVEAYSRPRGEGLVTAHGEIIGPAAWSQLDMDDVVLLDRFRADLRDITVHWREAIETWQWDGEVILLDVLGADSRLALRTQDGAGFFANAEGVGLEGGFVSAERSRIAIGAEGNSFDLLLDGILYLPELDVPGQISFQTELGFRLGTRLVRQELDLYVTLDGGGFAGDSASFTYAALPEIGVPAIETGFAGVTITALDASIAGLADPATAELAMDTFLDIGQGGSGPLMTLASTLSPTGARGLSGAGLLVHQSALLELVAGLDITLDNAFGTFGGTGHFSLSFDILGAALDASVDGSFLQYEGSGHSLEMRGSGEVTALPAWLTALYGVTEAFDVAMVASINPYAPADSFLDLSGPLYSAALGGYADFGLRYWFDGRLDLLDGIGLGDADLDGGGGLPGLFSFILDLPSERLVLRAEGDADAAEIVLVVPGGARLALADFAAAGIEVLSDDATGLTLLVNDAAAGIWQLEAPDATSFSGFATLPPLALEVTAITTAEGPGLRAVASWAAGVPAGGYGFRLFSDDDSSGFDGGAVFNATADADGVFEIAFADLGLAPGEQFFHVQVSAAGLSPVGAYLAEPVTIAGVADLTIEGDYFWVQPPIPEEIPEGESPPEPYPMLGITVTNEGTARAIAPTIVFGGTSIPPMQIEDLVPGEIRHLLLDLSGSGVNLATLYITLDIENGGFEADLEDNSVHAAAAFDDAPPPRNVLLTVAEDGVGDAYVLNNAGAATSASLVTGPLHGSLELIEDRVFRYTPDADFFGTDVFTYAAGGGEARVWITVTSVNDAPVLLAPIADATVAVGAALDLDLGALVTDIDSAFLGYGLFNGSDPLPAWLVFDYETGRLSGTPTGADLGSVTLTWVAFDEGLSVEDSFVLTVQAPGGGSAGPDLLSGSNGADLILALGGDDTVNGRNGADSIAGDAGRDRLLGAGGGDLLEGGEGSDVLDGGVGNDTVAGGTERDRLTGGVGADRFRFEAFGSASADVITDFVAGEDVIAVSAASFGGGLVAGVLGPAQFRTGLNARATSEAGTGQFIYETDAGKLWWDADGAGGAVAQIVARLAPMPGAALERFHIIRGYPECAK